MSGDTAQVWLVDARVPDETLAHLAAVLDEDESARARAYRYVDDRRRFIVAHGAARYILGGVLGVSAADLRWCRGAHGKPQLAGRFSGTPVNLSHSGDLTLVCVASRHATGVDIQRVNPDLDVAALAARFFPPDEVRYVATGGAAGRADRFTWLWSRKEAVVKAGGGRLAQGLRLDVREPVVVVREQPSGIPSGAYRLADVPVPDAYRAAVALYGEEEYRVTVRPWTWSIRAVHG